MKRLFVSTEFHGQRIGRTLVETLIQNARALGYRIEPIERQIVAQTMNYQVERWRRQDWLKGTRHYSSELRQDLFGQWVVLRRWGRISASKGQSLEHSCESYEEGLQIMRAIKKHRAQRGYVSL